MIRTGQPADMPDIVRIRTSVRENHLSVEQMASAGITPQSILADVASGGLGFWVAEDDGRIAGFAMADCRDGSVFALFMDQQNESRGHGSALLACCEAWLKQHGFAEASLTTEPGTKAHAFYLKRGWQPTGERCGLFAEDDVLKKRL